MRAWESYNLTLKKKKKEVAPYIIAYCDKDIPANARGYLLNYMQLDKGIFWNDAFTQSYNFAVQCLMGDNADEIPGVEVLTPEIKAKYGVKVNGVGKATAEKVLAGAETEEELGRRVIECYQTSYPGDWRQRLDDNAFFLYLLRSDKDKWDAERYFGEAWK
ncbi:hypothetical protein D3C78_1191810 [compost metagenome]